MKVTLYLDKDAGNTVEVKNKILSVLKPDHIIFDYWEGEDLKTVKYFIESKDGNLFKTKATCQELAICEYIKYSTGEKEAKIFKNYAQVLTWEQLICEFNNKYALCDGDKIVAISSQ